jgi:hypothetical protein
MVSAKSLQSAAMSGIALSILFAVCNGLFTYVSPNNETIATWVDSKVGAV